MGTSHTSSQSVNDAIASIKSYIGAASQAFAPRYDPSGAAARAFLHPPSHGHITEGMILQSRVGAYDYLCKVGMREVTCTQLSRNANCAFGAADCNLIPEGTRVLIYMPREEDNHGWILGVINMASYLDMNNQEVDIPARQSYEFEKLDAYWDNVAYNLLEGDKDYLALWANDNRTKDTLPGEMTVANENGAGYALTEYSASLTAGDSFVRVDRTDDEIRMRSTNYVKWTSQEAAKEFNDGGLLSAEGRNYSYQGELLGGEGRTGPHYDKPSDTEEKEPRPRTRWWRGFLGNLFSWFVVRPRKTKDEEDTGLASIHISQAGNVMARAAGGISLERYDAIPVPHRLKDEWDPQGDKEIEVEHKPLESFSLDDPHAAALAKSSRMAWDQKLAYQRFDELEKDFKVQQESETKPPQDEDEDPFESKELRLSEYRGRKAGVFIGDDGSVILRDAWGSEIIMLGGNIYLNTPGSIIQSANRDIVSMAGQSVALRGVMGADVTSDKGIVRVQSKRVVEIAGGSDDTPGGVLIESLGKGPYAAAPKEAGDSAAIGGVVIRAEESGVCLSAKNTYVSALDNVFITSGDNGKTRGRSNVFIDGGNVITTAEKTGMIVSGTNAVLISDSDSGGTASLLSNDGSALVAGKSAMIINGKDIPILWAPLEEKPDFSAIKAIWKTLQDSDVIKPMDWQNLIENAMFSFRKSSELRTDQGVSPWEPNGFRLYQPYWQVMAEMEVPTVRSTPVKPETEEIHESACWPGKEAMQSGKFVTVSVGDLNVEGPDMESKERKSLADHLSVQEKPFSEFQL